MCPDCLFQIAKNNKLTIHLQKMMFRVSLRCVQKVIKMSRRSASSLHPAIPKVPTSQPLPRNERKPVIDAPTIEHLGKLASNNDVIITFKLLLVGNEANSYSPLELYEHKFMYLNLLVL